MLMNNQFLRYKLLWVSLLFAGPYLTAQDNHYSWLQYGSRNSILNNANLSRFEDQSAVVINPATLSQATQSSFTFNTNAVSFGNIKFKDGLGKGFTIKNSNLNLLPSMASGVIKSKDPEKDLVLGYAIYSSNIDLLNFSDRVESKLDIINETESPGEENYLAQYNLHTNLSEVSVVLGAGWTLGNKISIGVSQTFVYRAQEYGQKFSAYAIPDIGSGATVDLAGSNFTYTTNFFKTMTFTRIGLIASPGKWDLGLVLTTPSLGLIGDGYILADINLINIRVNHDINTPRKNYVANGEFDKLKVKYKYPVNASFGVSRLFGKVRLYGSISWFGEAKAYNILDPGDAAFIQPPSDSNVLYTNNLLSLWSSNRMVINGSLAADWIIRPDYHLLFSVRSDNHYGEFDKTINGINPSIKQWDNYHFTVGAQRDFGSSKWVVGIRYNYANRKDYPQPISFSDPTEDNFFKGEKSTGEVTSTGLMLLLSYSFSF